MRIEPARIDGSAIIQSDVHADERGSFMRLRCSETFAAAGLPERFVQTNLSITHGEGMLRGMHYQLPPSREAKLVRCLRGRIHDVIVDLRPDSPSYLEHVAVELSGESGRALFVPSGCAHGFVTLESECYVHYEMTDVYRPDLARGVRWNDPAFAIDWPVSDPTGNDRDMNFPDYDPATAWVDDTR